MCSFKQEFKKKKKKKRSVFVTQIQKLKLDFKSHGNY